jgi:hypothetical protein
MDSSNSDYEISKNQNGDIVMMVQQPIERSAVTDALANATRNRDAAQADVDVWQERLDKYDSLANITTG